jgi:hypothetical protein
MDFDREPGMLDDELFPVPEALPVGCWRSGYRSIAEIECAGLGFLDRHL